MHGLVPGAVSISDFIALILPEQRARVQAALSQASEQGEPFDLHYPIARPDDGALREMRARGRLWKHPLDGGEWLLCATRDVTRDGSMRQAPQDTDEQRRLALALALSRTAIWEWSLDTQQVRCSEGMEALWGFAPGSFRGTLDEVVSRLHPDDLEAWRESVRACLEDGVPHIIDFRVLWSDGSVHWLAAFGDAVRDAEGRALSMAGVARDVTQYKLAEDERNRFFGLSLHLFVISDLSGTIRRVNRAWTEKLGYTEDELIGRRFLDFIVPEDVQSTLDDMGKVVKGRDSRHFENRYRCKDGSIRTIAWAATTMPEAGLLYAAGQDITDQKASEQALEDAVMRYRALVENMADGLAVYRAVDDGRDFVFTALNPAGMRLGALEPSSVIGKSVREVFPGVDRMGLFGVLQRVYRTGTPEVLPMARYEDERVDHWVENFVYRLPDASLVSIYRDVTDRKLAEQALRDSQKRLENLAYHDQLTGLPNRRLLQDRLQQAMAVASREHTQIAVCYLDLDNFKPVNDLLGHEVGDLLLKVVAERLSVSVRPGDTVARWGGDEFALLLVGLSNLEVCAQTLERILQMLSERTLIESQPQPISASIGVALYPDDHGDADTLLRHADHAMYLAKQHGRNTYEFFAPEEDRLAVANGERLLSIGRAIETDELRLLYQPILNMRSGVVQAFEALVRWRHPERGLLEPAAFLPDIESNELIHGLDQWVLEHALRDYRRWDSSGRPLKLHINISARTLMTPGCMQDIARLVRSEPGLRPKTLVLEIIESAALDGLEQVGSVVLQGELLGVSFALDDFGTGYSSLTYFRRLPARVLKIDRSFVRDMLIDQEDRDIVEGAIGLARAFGREVIAEGVEGVDHGVRLLHLGCELAQGFGIAAPMPAEAVDAWLDAYRAPADWTQFGCLM